ncbi:MAG: hypothetical protein RI946_205 [Pseudomonadota bacterium]|jgi:hypothetical protein|nr:hypothetical protein [Paracoccaceae bacterium]
MSDKETLTNAIRDLLDHKLLRDYSSTWRILWLNFLRGLAFGLGSVIGATILVYLTIQILAQIEFIPILGEWAVQLIEQIETKR